MALPLVIKTLLLIGLILCEGILGFLPGWAMDILGITDKSQIVGLQITIALIWMLVMRELDSYNITNLKAAMGDVSNRMLQLENASPQTDLLTHSEFYTRILQDSKDATKTIYTSNFNPQPPRRLDDSSEKRYYSEYVALVKKKPSVEFKRIELFHPEKIDWLSMLVKSFTGRKNASLYIIMPQGSELKAYSPFIAAQVVDHNVYLVAVAKHYSADGVRDILIKQDGVNKMWVDYYENKLLQNSVPAVANGVVCPDWDTIKRIHDGAGR